MPFPALEVFSAVSVASKLAWKIYEKGFRPGLQPDQDYLQLVHAVSEFKIALDNIGDVFERAKQEVERQRVEGAVAREQSLKSFKQIVGDFQATLEDCDRLLESKEQYARSHGEVAMKLKWNMLVVEEVIELRTRISFHHTRLSQMLQPFKISLTLSIKEAMERNFRDVRDDLREIKEALGLNPSQPVPSTAAALSTIPPVPAYLRGRFDNQADAERDLPVNDEVRISSVMGHLTETSATEGAVHSPRSQVVQKYVNLMKAVWILGKPFQSIVDTQNTSSSLEAVIWRDLQTSAIAGLNEFHETTGNFRRPTDEEISNCPSIQFALWIFQPGSRPLKPKFEILTETLLLEVPLENSATAESQQLIVASSKAIRTSLRVETSFIDSMGRTRERDRHNLNTQKAVLLPTYAQPGAQLLSVQVKDSSDDQQETTYQFRKICDLHKFQRCLTGFEVKHDQIGINGVKYKHSGILSARRMKTLSEACDVVRAQIWVHNPIDRDFRGSVTSQLSPDSTLSPHRETSSSISRRRSRASSARSQAQTIDEWAEQNAPSSYAPTIRAHNATAQEIPQPEESKVVLLLAILSRSDTSSDMVGQVKKIQYLTFALRDGVYIDISNCSCHRDKTCPVLVIKGHPSLSARLYNHSGDLKNWNLAALGQSGHVDAQQACEVVEGLDRIMISFQNATERFQFGDKINKARDLYLKRRDDYDRTVRRVQEADVVR